MRDKRANYGVCKANFVLAQKETKNVSHISLKSGHSVLKTKKTKGTQVHLLYAFFFKLMPLLYSLLHIIYAPQSPCAT